MTQRPEENHDSEVDRIFSEWLANQPDLPVTGGRPTPPAGGRPTPEAKAASALAALCAAHPEHADALRALHADYLRIVSLLNRSGPSIHGPALAERIREQYGPGVDPGITLEPQGAGPGPADYSSEVLSRLSSRPGASSRYRIQGELDRGGQGAILRVWDEDLRRHLAMKVTLGRVSKSETPPTPPKAGSAPEARTPPVAARTVGRFLEEAQVTGQLDHPGIVPVHELGLDSQGRVFFTMKLVKGEDLKAVFTRVHAGEKAWTPTRALSVLLRVCEAMSYAHSKGVIHRDLKPSNIMVGRFGEVYVMDWGLARVLDRKDDKDVRVRPQQEPLTGEVKSERRERAASAPDSPLFTMDGDVVGTPAYMSPEQASGKLERMGPPSDVYALGAMLYHLLTGFMPYKTRDALVNNYAILSRVQEGPPASVTSLAPDAPAELVAICEKAMAREPASRYADMSALGEELRAYLEHRVVATYETGAVAELRKWVVRNKALAASLCATLLAVFMGLGGIALVQSLGRQEAEKERTRAEGSERAARQSEAFAKSERDRADTQARAAEEKTRESRYQTYVGSIRGAAAAQQVDEPTSVRRFLDAAPEEYRSWEWGHLDAWADTSRRVLKHDTASVGSAIFSPDGAKVLTAPDGKTARIWDAGSGELLTVLTGHEGRVTHAAFNRDGSRVVTSSNDGTARIWNTVTGADLVALRGHTAAVSSVAFSPDGTLIATSSFDQTARIWNAQSGDELHVLSGHTQAVFSVAFSPDGLRLVTNRAGWSDTRDTGARLWDVLTGKELPLPGEGARVAFSPTGKRLAASVTKNGFDVELIDMETGKLLVSYKDTSQGLGPVEFSPDGFRLLMMSSGRVGVWAVATGVKIAELHGHRSWVNSASFSPDGRRIVTASTDNTARIWDAATGVQLHELRGHLGPVWSACFSPDGSKVVTAADDGTARLWNAETGTELQGLSEEDGSIGLVGTVDGGTWDADTGSSIRPFRFFYHAGPAAFSPDGARVLVSSSHARILEADTGTELIALHSDLAQLILAGGIVAALSHDGSRVVTADSDRVARVWDAQSGRELQTLRGHGDSIASVVISADGSTVATNSFDDTMRLWNAATGAEIVVLHDAFPNCVPAFSVDGSQVAAADHSESAHVLNAYTGVELAVLCGHERSISEITFSPDGKRIATASADRTARLWDAATGIQLALLSGHSDEVESAAFSPDGTRIVTTSRDQTTRLWDAATGTELLMLSGHSTGSRYATFSPDGTQILVADSPVSFSPDGRRVLLSSGTFGARLWDSVRETVRHP